MTTDEMILALVATGKFTLPIHYAPNRHATHRWFVDERESFDDGHNVSRLTDQHAHDLCAMHFARRLEHVTSIHADQFRVYIGVGDSAAAIKALYEAMKEQG